MNSIGAYHYDKNKIIINGHEHVLAPAAIDQCLVIDGFIVLLLNTEELKSRSNIYCYDISGSLKWVIEPLNNIKEWDYYTSIYILNDLCLYAYNIRGIEVKLDYINGQILSEELIK